MSEEVEVGCTRVGRSLGDCSFVRKRQLQAEAGAAAAGAQSARRAVTQAHLHVVVLKLDNDLARHGLVGWLLQEGARWSSSGSRVGAAYWVPDRSQGPLGGGRRGQAGQGTPTSSTARGWERQRSGREAPPVRRPVVAGRWRRRRTPPAAAPPPLPSRPLGAASFPLLNGSRRGLGPWGAWSGPGAEVAFKMCDALPMAGRRRRCCANYAY